MPVSFSSCSVGTYRLKVGCTRGIKTRIVVVRTCFDPCFPSTVPVNSALTCRIGRRRATRGILGHIRVSVRGVYALVGHGVRSNRLPGIGCGCILHRNLPRRRVVTCDGRCRPSLVIVKAHKGDRGSVSLVNDIANRIVRIGGIPILTVPRGIPFRSLDRTGGVTFTASFGRHSLITFSRFVRVVGPCGTRVRLFGVSADGGR